MGGPMDGMHTGMHPDMHAGMHRPDPAKMQERMARHQAELKAKLKIAPEQEAAWTSFTAALAPPAHLAQRPDRAEMEKLSTPERIDRMRALRATHQAEMDKRADATKAFYAALTPEQKKVFDAEHLRHERQAGWRAGMRGANPGPAK
jgi:Spy/CpxP family protein refolding chaperone